MTLHSVPLARQPHQPHARRFHRIRPDAETAEEHVAEAHEIPETLRHHVIAMREDSLIIARPVSQAVGPRPSPPGRQP
jgi:hypothetical protein